MKMSIDRIARNMERMFGYKPEIHIINETKTSKTITSALKRKLRGRTIVQTEVLEYDSGFNIKALVRNIHNRHAYVEIASTKNKDLQELHELRLQHDPLYYGKDKNCAMERFIIAKRKIL
jgi:hypothetical protein